MEPQGPLDADDYNTAVEFVVQNLDATSLVKGAVGADMDTMDKQINGHIEKAKIQLRHSLGQALQSASSRLRRHRSHTHDLDEEITIQLSTPPDAATMAYAEEYLDRLTHPTRLTPSLTWKDILAEEPFEGEHWEGVYGLPPGSVVNIHARSDSDEDSSPSLSPLESDDDFSLEVIDDSVSSADDHEVVDPPVGPGLIPINTEPSTRNQRFENRRVYESLRNRQYWHPGWHDATMSTGRPFDIGDPSTFGPSIHQALARAHERRAASVIDTSEREWHIKEIDAVRELLIAMQGGKNILLIWKDNMFIPADRSPKLVHLSLASQHSILSSLGRVATVVQQLRDFTNFVLSRSRFASQTTHTLPNHGSRPSKVTRTLEAFADALARQIRAFDAWCASREEAICRARVGRAERDVVVSLLSTEKAIQHQFQGSFMALREIVGNVASLVPQQPPTQRLDKEQEEEPPVMTWVLNTSPSASMAIRLLDSLLSAACRHDEREDAIIADALVDVFAATAEPIWSMVHSWLKNGMGLGLTPGQDDELDDEFFIEGTGLSIGMMGMGMGLLDPEFWTEGYVLRDGVMNGESQDGANNEAKMVPVFLKQVAAPVLSAGKSKGLLRALGLATRVTDQATFSGWRSFTEVLTSGVSGYQPAEVATTPEKTKFISIDTLSRLVYDELYPHCQSVGNLLAKVIVEECGFWKHLTAIEGFCLMRRGDVMSHFQDMIFAKMDAQQGWADFHSLNTVLNDVVQMNSLADDNWMEPSLVRLSFRGGKDKERSIVKSVKAVDGLAVEYAVPFPLTYIFPPRALQVYAEIFVFLLQIRRAKSVLEKILVRGEVGVRHLQSNMKIFYSMRSRLSWFINVFLNFLTTYVIDAQVSKFHSEFKRATSLDEMITLHNSHLEKLQGRCLLLPNTSALHRAVLSILDIALNFSNHFSTFAGDTSVHDISRLSLSVGHRSKRLKNQRRNVIGFSMQAQSLLVSDSDSDEDENDVASPPEASFSVSSTSTSADQDLPGRIEKMFTELDVLVRFVRRGVESLGGGIGEAAPTFGVLAFTLEDWDC
ncbi:hypothetical protein ONZ45_g7639 [Pleurotus djamor]|nr:hypothetical protein ONZ45_g7639 [Pleurotus djamor]